MSKVPQNRTPEYKFKLALEALKGAKTIVQLASEHGLHPKQIQRWRNLLLDEGEDVFIHKTTQRRTDPEREQLLHLINQLNLELEFLKKKLRRND